MAESSFSSVNASEPGTATDTQTNGIVRSVSLGTAPQLTPAQGPASFPEKDLSREDVARFVLRHESTIRQIARRKLTQATKAVFDSEDVMASVLRRMDKLAHDGALRPRSEGELWALIRTIASNTAVSRTRMMERARILLTEDGSYAYDFVQRLNACSTDDEAHLLVLRMAGSFSSERSRHIFLMRVRGASHAAIAALLNITDGSCRQQWLQMCKELKAAFSGGTFHA